MAKEPLTGIMRKATLALNKEGSVEVKAIVGSLENPARFGGLTGKALSMSNPTGSRKWMGTASKVNHRVVEVAEQSVIETVITIEGDGGLEKALGVQLTIEPLQRSLPDPEEETEE